MPGEIFQGTLSLTLTLLTISPAWSARSQTCHGAQPQWARWLYKGIAPRRLRLRCVVSARFLHCRAIAAACLSLAFSEAEGDTRLMGGGMIAGVVGVAAFVVSAVLLAPAEGRIQSRLRQPRRLPGDCGYLRLLGAGYCWQANEKGRPHENFHAVTSRIHCR